MSRNFIVGKSQIHGKGIFAARNFKKGDMVFIAKGKREIFSVHSKKESLFGPNWMSLKQGVWLNPKKDTPLTYLNHSCEPNLGVRGSVTFVTNRNINKGEELTVDYSTIELDSLWEMKCNCGAKKCRKIIKSIEFLPEKTYKHYLPYIPTYFMKVYNKSHG